MKTTRKILALLMALTLCLAIAAPAFADGTNGSVTVENATVGVTYRAYKVFDATYNGNNIAYTANETLFAALGGTAGTNLVAGPFTISGTADAAGNHNVQLTDPTTDVNTIAAWIESNLSKFVEVSATSGLDNQKKATANTVVFGNLAYGYYYVTSGLGTVVTIDSAKPTETVVDKNNQQPTSPNKVITEEDAVINDSDAVFSPGVEANDAAVGTKESFSVTYNATNWVTTGTGTNVTTKRVTKFYIEDQPRNMTIDPATIAVTVGSTSVISGGSVVDATGHPATVSVATGDAGKLEITIDWVDGSENSIYPATDGQATIPVTLTYDAIILPGAATNNADNTVTVKYDRTGDPKTDLGNDKTDTYTYHFTLTKTDATDDSHLTGAKFELTLGTTKVALIDVNGDGSVYRVAGEGETGTTTIDMKENWSIEIQGLDKQDYTLTEIEAPKGYNLLTSPVDVVGENLKKANEDAAEYTIDVDNNKGVELPSTGGIGTTIFIIAGSVLVLGAGIVLVAMSVSKRRSEEN